MIYQDGGSYPLYRIKGTDEISPFVGELAEKLGSVTLDLNALHDIRKYDRLVGFHSVFNEIEWINPYPDIRSNYHWIVCCPFFSNNFLKSFDDIISWSVL